MNAAQVAAAVAKMDSLQRHILGSQADSKEVQKAITSLSSRPGIPKYTVALDDKVEGIMGQLRHTRGGINAVAGMGGLGERN